MANDRGDAARLEPLDALRGVAALVVVLVHLHWAGGELFALPQLATAMIDFGSSGVILFFVVSGFSLDLTMAKHERSEKPLLSYAMARFFRIAPLFYLMIPITAASNYWHGFHTPHSLRDLLLNVGFLFNVVPGHQTGIVWASWTIGVEVIFYTLFPVIYRLPLLTSAALTLVPYAIVAAVWHPTVFGTFAWCSFAGYLPLFVIGMATHRAYVRFGNGLIRSGSTLFLIALGALAMLSVIPKSSEDVLLRLPIGLAYAALVLGALRWAPAFLSNSVTRRYGSLSYSVYLLHFPVLLALRPLFRFLLGNLPHGVAYALAIPLTLVFLTPVALLTHHAWEQPFERLRRHLQNRSSSATMGMSAAT